MQNLFNVVPTNLFSILSAPNRTLYFRALMVLRECYQRELKFHRSDLVTYLISEMERDLYEWTDELGDEATPETGPTNSGELGAAHEPNQSSTYDRKTLWERLEASGSAYSDGGQDLTLSGKAYAMVRRFVDTGWLLAVADASAVEETLLVPPYASVLLDAFHSIVEPVQQRYNAFVYSVYSNLRTANEERDVMLQALQSAHDNTVALRESLRSLLHNIHVYYQNVHMRQEIRELLSEHFDGYQLSVAMATYHPLKTFDSVYRFRPRILQILRDWLSQPSFLQEMAITLQTQRPDLDDGAARQDVITRIHFITDTFESLDELLQEIDRRNQSYNRASVERLQYLLNTDRDIKGKLVHLLKGLPPLTPDIHSPQLKAMQELPVYQVRYLDPYALYTEPTRRKRGKPQPLRVPNKEDDARFRAEAEQLLERMNAIFSQQRITDFIRSQMDQTGRLASSNLQLDEFDDFLRVMVAVIKGDEAEMSYQIEWDECTHSVVVDGYRIPVMTFVDKVMYQREEDTHAIELARAISEPE